MKNHVRKGVHLLACLIIQQILVLVLDGIQVHACGDVLNGVTVDLVHQGGIVLDGHLPVYVNQERR
jgi:hypothetical protein